ncbi:hypothetical protein JX265_010484 [Neoarthrinium moseri]|uniref:Pru domain-containing protein n=1 Tax=Neoarthrinium moseri TaxID=1658444 RepID=A0A9P9WEF0_9PEZI|nr:hypothetical protein JX265_010484 [Neoarthrinium moseri]
MSPGPRQGKRGPSSSSFQALWCFVPSGSRWRRLEPAGVQRKAAPAQPNHLPIPQLPIAPLQLTTTDYNPQSPERKQSDGPKEHSARTPGDYVSRQLLVHHHVLIPEAPTPDLANMSISPIITFKAGICEVDSSSRPYKVTAKPEPGYVYLYSEDDLVHFCWRERSAPLDAPELDLTMVPTDGHFLPYESSKQSRASAKTNGRVFVLKFMSSSQRYMFWMQSKPQGRNGDPAWFSPRDLKIGQLVHALLQGEEVDVQEELSAVVNTDDDTRRDDDDETMEDVEGHGDHNDPHSGGAGGAGPGATGGDVREEGEGAREGGADGARAAAGGNVDAATAVRNFLDSLKGGAGGAGGASQGEGKLYPMLSDLLTPPVTVPMARDASEEQIDELLSFLPPSVLILSQQADSVDASTEPTPDAIEAARQAMSLGQKKALLEKVLRSPQFHQSTSSLTMALRDGGLPSIAEALSIKVENNGYMKGSSMPLGGGDAVEAFVEGVKKTVEKK